MKRAVIVHGWDGRPNHCWYPKIKEDLEQIGYSVAVPFFETGNPVASNRLSKLEDIIEEPDEDLILIGHSIGAPTIYRYLENLEQGQSIKAAVFVAGFTNNLGAEELSNFFETEIDYPKIKQRCKNFLAIHSNNDPYVPISHGETFRENLGATLLIKENMGHFSSSNNSTANVTVTCTDLPEILEYIKSL